MLKRVFSSLHFLSFILTAQNILPVPFLLFALFPGVSLFFCLNRLFLSLLFERNELGLTAFLRAPKVSVFCDVVRRFKRIKVLKCFRSALFLPSFFYWTLFFLNEWERKPDYLESLTHFREPLG